VLRAVEEVAGGLWEAIHEASVLNSFLTTDQHR
jgi:hypothetical protein